MNKAAQKLHWVFRPCHQEFLSLLSQEGGETRFVGGCVRNALLGLPAEDFDCATTHPPDYVLSAMKKHHIKTIATGLTHGSVTACFKNTTYDVTTLRRDTQTDGRHAKVHFTSCWEEDAARRDFTVNALFLDKKGCLFDYFDGLVDLKNKRIRFIGPADKRIKEDHLRMLRFFRFQAFYGGNTFDKKALQGCIVNMSLLVSLSRDRITQELLKLLHAPRILPVARRLHRYGFFETMLGRPVDFSFFKNFIDIEKTLCLACDPLLRLKALMGNTKTLPPLALTRAMKQRLNLLSDYTRYNPFAHTYELLHRFPPDALWEWALLQAAENKTSIGLCPHVEKRLLRFYFVLKKWSPPTPFPLTGHDAKRCGVPGSEIVFFLQKTHKWWAKNHFHPSHKECLFYLKELYDSQNRTS